MTAETSYNITCGTQPWPVICNTTSTHCKNGDVWTDDLASYTFVENCTQLLRLECYRPGLPFVIDYACCIDDINRTTGNYTNELKGE